MITISFQVFNRPRKWLLKNNSSNLWEITPLFWNLSELTRRQMRLCTWKAFFWILRWVLWRFLKPTYPPFSKRSDMWMARKGERNGTLFFFLKIIHLSSLCYPLTPRTRCFPTQFSFHWTRWLKLVHDQLKYSEYNVYLEEKEACHIVLEWRKVFN